MTKTKGPDWNPRSLASFSTFGNTIPQSHSGDQKSDNNSDPLADVSTSCRSTSPSVDLEPPADQKMKATKKSQLNGILPSKKSLTSPSSRPTANQSGVKRKVEKKVSRSTDEEDCKSIARREKQLDKPCVSLVTLNGDSEFPEDVSSQSATGLENPVENNSLVHEDVGHRVDKQGWKNGTQTDSNQQQHADRKVKSASPSGRFIRAENSQAGVYQSQPDILMPMYNNPKYMQSIEVNISPSKLKGTPVAPPIVPRHAHSKSLVGDVSAIIKPSHTYSRSLVEDQLMSGGTANFENGVGTITLFLGPTDRRFGFSVVGGVDEGFPSRIDEMAEGSPADKADLEVGDEILEVNGKSLEDATHTEVISHIHQCIRSRTICLRVKRRTGNKLAADLAASSNVQDAFVIAVEQRARERLERLSALKKIKPVDISKLSSQLSDSQQQSNGSGTQSPSASSRTAPPSDRDSSHEDVNGVLEQSPIYVTSVPNLTTSATPVDHSKAKASPTRTRSQSSTPKRTSSPSPRHKAQSPTTTSSPSREAPKLQRVPSSSSSGRHHRTSSGKRCSSETRTTRPPSESDLEAGNKSGDELELTHDLDDDEEPYDSGGDILNTTGDSRSDDDGDDDVSGESGDSLPGTPEKTYGVAIGTPRSPKEVLIDSKALPPQERAKSPLQYTTSLESKDSSSSRKSGTSGGSSSGGTSSGGSRPPHGSRGSKNEPQVISADLENMISMVEFDPANKEMAVDVPDTFIGRTKTPPRYPPPKPQGSYGNGTSPTHLHNNNNNNNSRSSKGSKKGSSGSSGSVTPINGSLSKPVPPPKVPEVHRPIVVQSPNSQEEINKLKKYEEEIKQRREREEAAAELQRTSIRGSQKLQALASYPQGQPQSSPSGIINQAFDQDDAAAAAAVAAAVVAAEEQKGKSPSINELIQSLQRIQGVLKSNGHRISEDMTLVAQLLVNPEFQKVLAVHNKVQETWCLNRPPTPYSCKSQELVSECMELLKASSSPEAIELVEVLSKYTLESVFYAHDRIADSEPIMEGESLETSSPIPPPPSVPAPKVAEPSVERATNYPGENVRIVKIDKTNEPLGATIRNEGDSVIIGRIVQGGAAEKSGLLHEGDEILEVNGVEVRGKSVNDVCDMLAGMTGTLTFYVIPTSAHPVTQTTSSVGRSIHVKAHFDYDPEEDLYIPCRELGISFQKGDILRVINQSDANWWQAYRDGEDDQSLAGLIPSKTFQQQREAMRQTVVGDSSNKEKSKKGKLLCAKKHQKKKKKKMLYPNYNEDYDAEEILTYEQVDLYFPSCNRKRPIVLIGPPNIGRHELRQKLMEDRERFAAAVPHTSRPKRDRELDGQDYHFISRTQFEADILTRKFVEHGEYEKAYYGTSLDAIRAVVNSGKICVLNLHPLSLKMLKNSDLKPYVVLIAPPSLEKLRQKKTKANEPFKEEELKEIIQKAREMEDRYGHYFDLVLINTDIERTYQQLIHEINVLERDPQWVPASWLENER